MPPIVTRFEGGPSGLRPLAQKSNDRNFGEISTARGVPEAHAKTPNLIRKEFHLVPLFLRMFTILSNTEFYNYSNPLQPTLHIPRENKVGVINVIST